MIFDLFDKYIIADGAMGTMLQRYGLERGERSDLMSIKNPGAVEEIHRMYVKAGADIIYTNTFGANSIALKNTGYSPSDVITSSLSCAKRAAEKNTLIALDMGPTGALLEPMGDMNRDQAYELFMEQAIVGEREGADLVVIETVSDTAEIKSAVLAVKENTSLPIVATMTFNSEGNTYLGCSIEDMAKTAENLEIAAVGINCSLAPSDMSETVKRLAKATNLPLILKLNAGLPDGATGAYNTTPDEYCEHMLRLCSLIDDFTQPQNAGIRKIILGGCCGTTPEYISKMREAIVKL